MQRTAELAIVFADGTVSGMPTTKVTVTLDADQVEEILALVAQGEAATISAFVRRALCVALTDTVEWREMLHDALRQTGGPLTAAERAWADEILLFEKSDGPES
jgi:Arc/MetJ-type ribon-helix-helix transcriptional regulator